MYTKNGFTLMELIVCLAIISILACFSIPSLNILQSVYLESSSKELLYDIRLAQQKSLTEGVVCHIYFNSNNNSYSIAENSTIYKSKKMPEGIRFYNAESSFVDNKIAFNILGNPIPRPCTISLINKLGHHREIVISVATNYIYLKER